MTTKSNKGINSSAPQIVKTPSAFDPITNLERSKTNPEKNGTVFIPFHDYGPTIVKHEQNYSSAEGIVRVVRMIVHVLSTNGYRVIVSSYHKDASRVLGFFKGGNTQDQSIEVMIVNFNEIKQKVKSWALFPVLFKSFQKSHETGSLDGEETRTTFNDVLRVPVKKIIFALKSTGDFLNRYLSHLFCFYKILFPNYIKSINRDPSIDSVIVPHYFLFPEVLRVEKPVSLYLPDYLPHFYPDSAKIGAGWRNRLIGKRIVKKAQTIFTNSQFTKSYLPDTALKVDPEKIVSFPLPYLNSFYSHDPGSGPRFLELKEISGVGVLDELPPLYVFYPTQNRPSKRLTDFVRTVSIVNNRLIIQNRPERLNGVLTTPYCQEWDEFIQDDCNRIMCISDCSDQELVVAYQKAVALLFTSENEGNFPTQINEALHLKIPLVGTNIPMITQELEELSDNLFLYEPGDCESMATALIEIIDHKKDVLNKQSVVQHFAIEKFSYQAFERNFLKEVKLK